MLMRYSECSQDSLRISDFRFQIDRSYRSNKSYMFSDLKSSRLGCHPASNLLRFTFGILSWHQPMQATERAWNVTFPWRQLGFVFLCRICAIVQKIQSGV